MIVLYEVIPGPMGDLGEYGRVVVEWAYFTEDDRDLWVFYPTHAQANAAAAELCDRIAASNPGPGLRGGPVDVIVVKHAYNTVLDVARRKPAERERVALFGGWEGAK